MRKYILRLIIFVSVTGHLTVSAQCSLANIGDCDCPDGTENCELLPDLKVAEQGLLDLGNVIEYPQTNAGENFDQQGFDDGRLRITVSTPNLGYGPLEISPTDRYICGRDTITGLLLYCDDGNSPRRIMQQKVYSKSGSTLTDTLFDAGAMAFHPTHGHNHLDDWAEYSLRMKDDSEPNPLKWPIVADGTKLGFCLRDDNTCNFYFGHCKDGSNQTLLNNQIPNFELGGGAYFCTPTSMGISVGYTDIYHQDLPEMWIDIPPGTCNGEYYIVVEVDPKNLIKESNEINNIIAVPFTLTQQSSVYETQISSSIISQTICDGNVVKLTSSAGTDYLWSTGETTQSIYVSSPGDYFVRTTASCGTDNSDTLSLNELTGPNTPVKIEHQDTICEGDSITLKAVHNDSIHWFNAQHELVYEGSSFHLSRVDNDTAFYAKAVSYLNDTLNTFPTDSNYFTTGEYIDSLGSLEFTAHHKLTIVSVDIYAENAGLRNIVLRRYDNTILQSQSVNLVAGKNTIALDFTVEAGGHYILESPSGAKIFRSRGGVYYPFGIPQVLDITYSGKGNYGYYFFYNWKVISESIACYSEGAEFEIYTQNCKTQTPNLLTDVEIFPNPATEFLTIKSKISMSEPIHLQFFDLLGKSITPKATITLNENEQQIISVNKLSSGYYLLMITSGDQIVQYKILKI